MIHRIAADLGLSSHLDHTAAGDAWIDRWCEQLSWDLAKLEAFDAYLNGARRDKENR